MEGGRETDGAALKEAMMRDKDPERGINSGAERRSGGKERLKKCEE